MTTHLHLDDLHEELERWVAEGLMERAQASRIESVEVQRQSVEAMPEPVRHGVPMVVEALGYLGGLLAAIAGFIAVRELWPDITTTGQMVFAGIGCALLLGAGGLIRAERDPAYDRLRSVLWALATGCFVAFAGLFVDTQWDLPGLRAALVVAAVSAVFAGGLWLRSRAPLQQIVMYAGIATTVGTGVAAIDPDVAHWSAGPAVWLLSLAWAAVAYRTEVLAPREVAYLVAAVGALVGAQLTMFVPAGHVLALLTVAGLLAAGVLLRRVWLLAIGAIAVVQVVPQTAIRYLPESVGAPIALFVVGVALLGVALRLARGRRTLSPPGPHAR